MVNELEDLNLKSCGSLKHAKVITSTPFILHSRFNMLDSEIHVLNLVFFEDVGKLVQCFPEISSSNLETEIHLEKAITDIGYNEVIKLKKLL